jgi:outer membrane protein assembly factor BamB
MARSHALGAANRRRSRRDGLRALVIVTMFGSLLLGLAACTLFGSGMTTAPVRNIDAPVPSGSGLYYLQFAQDNSGSHYNILRADAVTGKPQWQQALPGNVPKIAVRDGIIYAVNGLDVLALRGSDGTKLWNTTLNVSVLTQSNSFVHVRVQPVVADDHVYISIDDGESLTHGQVVALRVSDGAQLWSRAFDDFYNSDNIQPLAAGDGFVFVTSVGNGIHALQAADGSLAWQAQYKGVVQLLGGLVYVDDGPAPLVALDEHTGALVWTLPCWKQTGIAPSASGAQIYIGCLDPHNPDATGEGVFAFDTHQRQLLWKYHAYNFNDQPVVASDRVLIPVGTTLAAVRASDGKQVWSQQAEEPNAGPVALALIGDTLYVRVSLIYPHVIIFGCGTSCKQSYSLSALRTSDGAAYWRHYEPSWTLGLIAA